MPRLCRYIWLLMKESAHSYFVPIIGAYKGIKHEYRVLDRKHKRALKKLDDTCP